MNSRERGPGKIRRAKDRQEASQILAYGDRAAILLDTYAWSSGEEAFLRFLAEKKFSFSHIKQLTWDQIILERGAVRADGREHYLSPATMAAVKALHASNAGTGEPLFSPETARALRIDLSRAV